MYLDYHITVSGARPEHFFSERGCFIVLSVLMYVYQRGIDTTL